MVYDNVEFKANKGTIMEGKKKVTVELDFTGDELLQKNQLNEFAAVGEHVPKALTDWERDYNRITKQNVDVTKIADNMSSVLDLLPKMTEKKNKLDMHLSLGHYLLKQAQERKLDEFMEMEIKIMTSKSLGGSDLKNLEALVQSLDSGPDGLLDR